MEISGNKLQLMLKILMSWQTSDFPHLHSLFELSSPQWELLCLSGKAESPAELSPALSACFRNSHHLTTSVLQCQQGVLKNCKGTTLRNLRHESLSLFQSHNRLHKNVFSNKTICHYLQISDNSLLDCHVGKQKHPVSKNLIP